MTTVTCAILSHNHREFAVQAVESALRQEYPAELLDVVILDDGSRDGTGDLLEQTFGDNPRVTVLRQENQGFVRSTNRVVAAATLRQYWVWTPAHGVPPTPLKNPCT